MAGAVDEEAPVSRLIDDRAGRRVHRLCSGALPCCCVAGLLGTAHHVVHALLLAVDARADVHRARDI